MKAKELMIGDWVVNPVHKDARKIEGVYYDKELHCLVATDGRFPQQFFEPIPLTAEILEKNGYLIKEQGKTNMLMVRHGNGYYIEVFLFPTNCVFKMEHAHYLSDKYVTDIVHKCGHYVHELQHALRLCGLNELADNFKV